MHSAKTTGPYEFLVDARALQPGYKQHLQRGIGSYAQQLLKNLPVSGDLQFTFLVDPQKSLEQVTALPNIGYLAHRTNSMKPRGAGYLFTQWALGHQLRKRKFDGGHFLVQEDAPLQTPFPFCVTMLDTIGSSLPQLYGPIQHIKHRVLHAISRKVARQSAHIITISEHSKRDIIRQFGIPEAQISVVYLAAQPAFYRRCRQYELTYARKLYGLPQTYFLYVGGIDPRKNVPTLLEGYAAYATETEHPVVLVLAGDISSQKEYPQLRHTIDNLKLSKHVLTPGYVAAEHLPAVYAAALALLFPSLYEGFGLPVLEAMACGTPVMTTRLSSIPEVAGDAALYIEPTQVRSIKQALHELDENELLRRKLSGRGREQAKKFSWIRTVDETLAVYYKILREHHPT